MDNEILGCYQQRVRIEQVHYDGKLLCGFNSCHLHSAASIEGYLSLSLLACGVAEYLRSLRHPSKGTKAPSTLEILKTLGMHWYHPTSLTRGLTARYLEHQLRYGDSLLPTFRAAFSQQ